MTALHQITETASNIANVRQAPARSKANTDLQRSVMAKAWHLWNLAQDVAKRPVRHDWHGLVKAFRAEGKSLFEAKNLADQDWLERREVQGINSFSAALMVAWSIMVARRNLRRTTDAANALAALREANLSDEDRAAESARIVAGVKSFRNE